MELQDLYTSTGMKYYRNYEVIQALRKAKPRPHSLQISLTSRCNLNCRFCSVEYRDKNIEWNYRDLTRAINLFAELGIKTVEFTGAGEPTLYSHFAPLINFCKGLDLKLGLITNGLNLYSLWESYKKVELLENFDWIRVSMNALDMGKDIKLPLVKNVTLGLSYVVDFDIEKKRKILQKIKEKYTKRYNVAYVRVVPDCFADKYAMQLLHQEWGRYVGEELKYPFFFQYKTQKQAKYCWIDCIKPWLHIDGYVYACNSLSLLSWANKDFPKEMRLCKWNEVKEYYKKRGFDSLDVSKCDRCTFTQNNEIIKELIRPILHEEWL